ncbi:alpha-amylase [Klebsormidium nitens]|uniref:alpha-amylase n=1 Tax=Klebsormidium nitens TaxID=105231 RepID=A0A1Y1HJM0_KLENI|nr:alpha-amylase [Klebsormidium nitens]|eukprot:GAQ78735.1 alpha-amylase [Klebsormidium nitens]
MKCSQSCLVVFVVFVLVSDAACLQVTRDVPPLKDTEWSAVQGEAHAATSTPHFLGPGVCRVAAEWTSRSIYEIVVDRFAPDQSITLWCGDLSKYCGGTFAGITDRLDYIQGMGFDAISISPVIENVDGGYHGYWPKDLFNLNGHFGSATSLKRLIQECHSRGIWVMVDVVMNHMGGVTDTLVQNFSPFNESSHYHDCYYNCCGNCGCCSTQVKDCKEEDTFTTESCRVSPHLIDLDQSHPYVEQRLLEWLHWIVSEFGFDGLRFDAVKHVSKSFWKKLKASSPCFFLGDVPTDSACFLASYQSARTMDGLLDHPTAATLRSVFGKAAPMTLLAAQLQTTRDAFVNGSTALLGTFLDTHALPRFLAFQPNQSLLKGALAWTFLSQGIPVMYYGTEQGLSGGADPENREPLWYSGFNSRAGLYSYVKQLQEVRKEYRVWEHEPVHVHAEEGLYMFMRGPLLVVLTNSINGGEFEGVLERSKSNESKFCDILAEQPSVDCFDVPEPGHKLKLSVQGYSTKVYAPFTVR